MRVGGHEATAANAGKEESFRHHHPRRRAAGVRDGSAVLVAGDGLAVEAATCFRTDEHGARSVDRSGISRDHCSQLYSVPAPGSDGRSDGDASQKFCLMMEGKRKARTSVLTDADWETEFSTNTAV